MLHIALCDDDESFAPSLQEKIAAWFQNNKAFDYHISIQTFSSSEHLASIVKETPFDMFFLDIEMPGLDGMKLAKQIRDSLPWAIIIFLTSHDEFAPDGYRVQALRYLSKHSIETQLDEALGAAVAVFKTLETGTLDILSYGKINRIPYRDILYVRHILRHSFISTISQGTIQDGRGIKELFDVIGNERFLFIDRGTFVNIDHIQRIEDGKVILMNGEGLIISRRMISQVKMMINRILGG